MALKPMKQILTLVATVLFALGAQAKNYIAVFSQNFEDSETYTDNFVWGILQNAAFGTTESTPSASPHATVTQEERTIYGTSNKSKFFQFKQTSSTYRNDGCYYQFTEAVTNLDDYKIEFDWYPAASTIGYCSGLAIQGKKGVLATFYMAAGTKNGLSDVTLYPADDKTATPITTFKTTQRSIAPANESTTDYDNAVKYWIHITIEASVESGVVMNIVRADGEKLLVNYRLSDFDNVVSLFQYYSSKNNYGKYQTLDDVAAYKAAEASVFTWSGSAGDCKWSTPGNWTIAGVQQTAACPGEKDTAIVAGEGLSITAAVGLAVSNLNFAVGSKLFVDVNGAGLNQKVTLLNVKENVGAALTAENVFAFDSAGACAPVIDFSTMPITAMLYDKSKFFWTGNGGSSAFSTAANWVYGLESGPVAETGPTGNSTVTFPASFTEGVTVKFAADASGDGIYFVLNCNVTFASASTEVRTIYPWSVTGTGTLSLANCVKLQTVTGKGMTMGVDVSVLPSSGADPWASNAQFFLRGEDSSIVFNGDIKGAGYLYLGGDANPTKYYYFNGDLSGFTGKISTQYNWSSKRSDEANTLRLGSAAALSLGSATLEVVGRVWVTAANDAKTLFIGKLLGTGIVNNCNANAMTLEVGALNADAEASVVLTNNQSGVGAWTVKKVGTGTQTLTDATVAYGVDLRAGALGVPPGKAFGSVALNGGQFKFAIPYDEPWTNGTMCTLFTCTSGVAAGRTVDYVTLDFSAFTFPYAETYDNTVANVLKVSLEPKNVPFVWNGPVNGLWSVAANWLLDEKPASISPGVGSTAQIGADAVIVVDAAQTFGKVLAESSATLAVLYTDSQLTFTAPAGFAGTVAAAGPYAATGAGGVFTATRVASTFTWAGADGLWTDLANWKVGSYPTGVLPGGNDTAEFPSALSDVAVTVSSSDQSVAAVVADANLTLVGTTYLRSNCIRGEGLLTLGGCKILCLNANLDISNDVAVATGTENELRPAVDKNSTFNRINLRGDLSGDGNIKANHGGVQRGGVAFYGDNHAFAGTFETSNFNDRDSTYMDSFVSSSSNAVWKVNALSDKSTNDLFPSTDDAYKYFGAYIGNAWLSHGTKMEIGHRDDVESTLYAYAHINYDGYDIRKVGSNVLNLKYATSDTAVTKVDALYLEGGTVSLDYSLAPTVVTFGAGGVLSFPGNVRDLSAAIVNSTAAIAVDDGGTSATWTTALAASNTGGLTKKGAGTLTLKAVPKYAGVTKVEAGKLVVPDGTKLALDATSVAGGIVGGVITNVLYSTAETTTLVSTDASSVNVYDAPVDVSNLTVDLSERTEWDSGLTYYVVSPGGIIVGTSIENINRNNLILPADKKGQWMLKAVDVPGKGKALAVIPVSAGLIVTFE